MLSVYSRPDSDVRREILDRVLLDTLLVEPARFTVSVEDGIVTVEGTPETALVGRDVIRRISEITLDKHLPLVARAPMSPDART